MRPPSMSYSRSWPDTSTVRRRRNAWRYYPAMTYRPPHLPSAPVSPLYRTETRTSRAWTALPVQVVLTGFITYVVIAACSVLGGTFTEGLQIVGIAVFSTPLTIAAFVLGLPLRLIPRARSWWFRRAEWTFVVFVLAALVLCLSYVVGRAGPVTTTPTHSGPHRTATTRMSECSCQHSACSPLPPCTCSRHAGPDAPRSMTRRR